MIKLINFILKFGSLIVWKKFLQKYFNKILPWCYGLIRKTVLQLFSTILEGKIDQPKFNSILSELLESHCGTYFLKFLHKNICIFDFDKFGKYIYDLGFNFKIGISLWQSDIWGLGWSNWIAKVFQYPRFMLGFTHGGLKVYWIRWDLFSQSIR